MVGGDAPFHLKFALKVTHPLRPIIKSHSEEKWGWPWVPCNISAGAGASDFKFIVQLEFVKVYHKNIRRKKVGVAVR